MTNGFLQKEPHVIKELVAGHTYMLERKHFRADGYVTAESILYRSRYRRSPESGDER